MSNSIDPESQMVATPEKDYALSGKIMLSAIIILFAVVIFMAVLHLYARWYLLRLRRRQLQRRRHNRRTHIVFYVDNHHPNSAVDHGLEAEVLNSLPLFAYSSKTHTEVLECAVCLSEFEENETGRFLPKCSHSFHIECIDMWFRSHSTCPLCRSSVEPVTEPEKNRAEIAVNVDEPGSSSGNNTESLGARRKGLDMVGVRIEVPRRNEFDRELRLSSPASQGFKSPGARLLSLRRLLSMNKKSPIGTPGGSGTSCGPVGATELDLENGRVDFTQESTPVHTPR
ncbi:RING-H2 finger protein ATL2 [Abeliophyllum distichum]|uniref:RING-type E3 ubiquitin transferase n=1 Tax=Abeliophyllum distichum TaxID=126358 RepID=A0ABD1VBD6_9LAMI